MTALEQIHKELKERFKDEPNINLILMKNILMKLKRLFCLSAVRCSASHKF